MNWITRTELELLPDYYLVDVRTHKQFVDGHLEHANNFPIVTEKLHYQLYDTYHNKGVFHVIWESFPHLSHFWHYFKKLKQIGKQHETIVIYCSRARFRSKLAYRIVRFFNRHTYILSGGIKGIDTMVYEALCSSCGAEHVFNEVEM
ncbi:MAG: rhodanese-like domain-containing protein, partial [Culicoidibacterales bacterium]